MKRHPSDETTYVIWFGSAMVGWILGGVVAFLLFGCAAKQAAPQKAAGPIEVKIVEMPAKQSCWISELPEPPEEIRLEHEKPDVIGRSFVHVRQMNDLLVWIHDMNMWRAEVERCLYSFTGVEP